MGDWLLLGGDEASSETGRAAGFACEEETFGEFGLDGVECVGCLGVGLGVFRSEERIEVDAERRFP